MVLVGWPAGWLLLAVRCLDVCTHTHSYPTQRRPIDLSSQPTSASPLLLPAGGRYESQGEFPVSAVHMMQITGRDEFLLIVSVCGGAPLGGC